MSVKVLGISAFYHDSAAVLTEDGRIVAAAQEERFTRKKHDPGFPSNAAGFCLSQSSFGLKDLDAVVFYDKPLLKFERLLETSHVFAPRGFGSFVSAAPVWLKEKLFLRRLIKEKLAEACGDAQAAPELLFSSHHLSHAASAFFPSPFEKAAILTIDGVGEWTTASISLGDGGSIKMMKELKFPHSVGLLYSAFTYYLGFRVNSGEYKLMGLAPYGDPGAQRVKDYERGIKKNIVSVKGDGSVFLNQDYFDYCAGETMTKDAAWEKLFGFPRRLPEAVLEQRHCDLAMAIQNVTGEIVLKMAAETKRLTGEENLCLAGGVALNCVANSVLLRAGIFKNIWIQPAAGDAGGALGAALAASHAYFGVPRTPEPGDAMRGAYLGPEFTDSGIIQTAEENGAVYTRFENTEDLFAKVAGLLAEGFITGWFQGRMEWGPRALGNRSILADPRDPEMQKRLNLKIKYREGFRPFAPSVTVERAAEYFNTDSPSPYMTLTAEVTQSRQTPLPKGYHSLPLGERLYFKRSDIPCVTHLDYSARLQTVDKETNPRYWGLLEAFRKQTGCAVLVNTSFNVRGEPIVCTPADAYRCFMRTEMDYLVMGDFLFAKKDQPAKAGQAGGMESAD